jgi:hypothetical protein
MAAFLKVVFDQAKTKDALERVGLACERIEHMRLSIGATAPYAGYVHEGTSRMAARPFLSLAITRHAAEFERDVAEAIPDGPQAVMRAITNNGRTVLDAARAEAPVRTGYLRGSLYMRLR